MGPAILRTPDSEEKKELTQKAQELLRIFNLSMRQNEVAKGLPYGEPKELEMPGPWQPIPSCSSWMSPPRG